jgi:hypothetical protein
MAEPCKAVVKAGRLRVTTGHKRCNGSKVHGVVDALAAVSQAMICIGLLAWVCLHHRWPKVGRAAQ